MLGCQISSSSFQPPSWMTSLVSQAGSVLGEKAMIIVSEISDNLTGKRFSATVHVLACILAPHKNKGKGAYY